MQKQGIKLLTVNAFVWIATAFYTPFIGAFYAQKNISTFQIGILMAIGPVASILIQPLWAALSDRTGKRRTVLMIITMGSACAGLFYLTGSTFHVFFLATILITSFNTALLPLSDAIITGSARDNGLNFAHIRMGGTLGYAVVVLLIGSILKKNPSHMFFFCFAGYGLLTLICFLLPKDPPKESEKKNAVLEPGSKRIFKTNQVIFVLIFALIIQLGMSFHGAFLGVYVVNLGYSQSMIGVMNCVSALSEVPILLCANRLIHRFGAIRLLGLSGCMLALRILLVTGETIPMLILSQLLQSVSYMTSYYSCVVYVSENVMEGKMSRGQSMLAMVQAGIGSVGGSIFGGWLTGVLGLRHAYLIMAGAVLAATVVNILVCRMFGRKMRPAACTP